jgi:glucoamylase
VVSDGKTFTQRERDSTVQRTRLLVGLSCRQVNTAKSGRWRITKTHVTDPRTSTLLIRVRFQSLTRKPLKLFALYDPSLNNGGMDDNGISGGRALLASDGKVASALVPSSGFTRTSSGYLGTSDGWQDLRSDHRMNWQYRSAPSGNVVQTGRTRLNGKRRQRLTLALGFGGDVGTARHAARESLSKGFARSYRVSAAGWRRYLSGLKKPPRSVAGIRRSYDASMMVLAALEDKTFPGAYVASPTMPWAWGLLTIDSDKPSGPYHLVWSRDLYQIATALLAAGDKAGANRALSYLFNRQQKPNGSFPQNTYVWGEQRWTSLQLDEVALPIVLAWQLKRFDAATYKGHVKKAAAFIAARGPVTEQERWENQSGYSPGTIASDIAGLITAADIARRNGDTAAALRWEAVADDWQSRVNGWTATTNGPYSPKPYYLRVTKDGNPNAGTTYSIGDGGPGAADQRTVTDPSFLELVRLGVKRWNDPTVKSSLAVVDQRLGVDTPNGRFWHRFDFDGYGETKDGGPWDLSDPDTFRTKSRLWPIFAGERGEYELLAGDRRAARGRLASIAKAGNRGYLIPEQVWDENPPSGRPGFPRGEGTLSATPLAWSHAQLVRLAWSIQAGHPVERPRVVACRYSGC